MRLTGVRIEIKQKSQVYRCAVWMLVLFAGVCRALAQQHEQAAPQENLTIQDSISVQVIKFDDVPVKAGEDFNFSFLLNRVRPFPGAAFST
jgi:hypothetical protein